MSAVGQRDAPLRDKDDDLRNGRDVRSAEALPPGASSSEVDNYEPNHITARGCRFIVVFMVDGVRAGTEPSAFSGTDRRNSGMRSGRVVLDAGPTARCPKHADNPRCCAADFRNRDATAENSQPPTSDSGLAGRDFKKCRRFKTRWSGNSRHNISGKHTERDTSRQSAPLYAIG